MHLVLKQFLHRQLPLEEAVYRLLLIINTVLTSLAREADKSRIKRPRVLDLLGF